MKDEELNQQHLLIQAFTSKIYFLWLTTLPKEYMYYKSWNFKKKKKAAAYKLLSTGICCTNPNLKRSKSQNFLQNTVLKKNTSDCWKQEDRLFTISKHTESQELQSHLRRTWK